MTDESHSHLSLPPLFFGRLESFTQDLSGTANDLTTTFEYNVASLVTSRRFDIQLIRITEIQMLQVIM